MGLRTSLVLLVAFVGLLPASAPQRDSSTAAASKALVGAWQLQGNPRFTRTFTADGMVTDRFQGNPEDTTKGAWRLFTARDRDPLLDSVVPGVTYLRVENGGDVTFYAVIKLDRKRLDLRYADRGGSLLRFTRVGKH